MYKFFVDDNQVKQKEITIIGQDVIHIRNVLRLNIGNDICICNKNTQISFKCTIKQIEKDIIICNIEEEIKDTSEPKTYIHIYQGLPKSDKMEYIIEKCTEIGVKEITPVIMKRTIVKLDEKEKTKKIIRWQKIAEVASKQSKRDKILKVNNIINFKNIFEEMQKYDIVLVAYEKEKEKSLKETLVKLKEKNKILKVAVIIGPEGGFDNDEVKLCNMDNMNIITLGKRILRTETASLVISGNILYELEEE